MTMHTPPTGLAQARWSSYRLPRMDRLKTYIVEDSAVSRENLIATLQELTAVEVVGFAEDESSATAWLNRAENVARLVIVDVFLKHGSGLGVLQSTAHNGHERKWVVFSNYATPAMRSKCLAMGADRLFDKSTEIDGLIAYCNLVAEGGNTDLGGLS